MHIQDFFQNFLKLFLIRLYGNCTINLIAHDMSPLRRPRTLHHAALRSHQLLPNPPLTPAPPTPVVAFEEPLHRVRGSATAPAAATPP